MSWPPGLLPREWKPARRRLQVLAVLRQIGETAEPRVVDLLEAVRTAALSKAGVPHLGAEAEASELRRVILAESLRGLWEVKASVSEGWLTIALNLDRVRDLARDPALDPRVGDEGQPMGPPLSWRRVELVREHGLVVSIPEGRHGHQETWARARWVTWAASCGTWLRAGTAQDGEMQQLVARLGLRVGQ